VCPKIFYECILALRKLHQEDLLLCYDMAPPPPEEPGEDYDEDTIDDEKAH
jgi:hypothetical protein